MITELVQYITSEGDIINLNSPPTRGVRNMTGWGAPPITASSVKSPYQHGNTWNSFRLQPRNINMQLYFKGDSRSQWWNERTNLLNRLGLGNTNPNYPVEGKLRWEYIQDGAYKTRDLECYLNTGLIFDNSVQWHNWGIIESLQFVASNPIIYDPTQTTVTINSFDDELILPVTFPFLLGTKVAEQNITYQGTWPTYPTIEIDGACSGVAITNETAGATLRLDYFIQTGITVTIDTGFGNKSVTDSLGNNLINYLKDSDLVEFALLHDPRASGGVNTFSLQLENTNASTEVRVKYYNRYYGI